MKRIAPIVVGLLAVTLAWIASAQTPRTGARRLGVRWDSRVPHVYFSARDLVNASVKRKLESGLPQTIVMRVHAYPDGRRSPIAVTPRSCRVAYDLWEQVYRIEVQTTAQDRSETVARLDGVLARCLTFEDFPVGEARDYEGRRAQSIYFAVLVELNPLSQDTVQRIRRWLARRGSSRIESDAFIGSFVSLFVNRRLGQAERTLRFRSQSVRIP